MELIPAGVLGALFLFGALRWRGAVIGALLLTVFEGAIRKWVFPESQEWIYLSKDFLLLGSYLGFLTPRMLRHQRLFPSHPANGLLAALAALGLFELVNPFLPNLLVGLFGLRAHLLYVPLMYMVPSLFPDAPRLRRLAFGFMLASMIPLLLGPIQFSSSPDSILNRYPWEGDPESRVAVFGSAGMPRITGTFSYITGYTTYLVLVILTAFALALTERRPRVRWALYAVLGLAVSNLFMTGSRGPFLILAAAVPALLILTLSKTRDWARVTRVLSVLLVVLGLVSGRVFPDAWSAFWYRVQGNADVFGRIVGAVRDPMATLADAGVLGYGIGTAHQAAPFLVAGELGDSLPPAREDEWGRIILELGPFGFALVLLIRIAVVHRLWTAVASSRDAGLQPFLTVALLFALAHIPGNLVFDHTASVLYWFVAGVALIAPGRRQLEPPASSGTRERQRAGP